MTNQKDEPLERFDLASLTPFDQKYAALRDLFPETFSESEPDPARLASILGVSGTDVVERYGLTWPGKANAATVIQKPSVGTLRLDSEKSVAAETGRDVVIEGDNLEVLKLMQRSYHGKVKMIYIDPPYNTGKQFIYPDNFREGLDSYLQFTGQADEEGRKLFANAETDGRYHSNWLSMMYPRLALARNLLRSDGIIFVTIDDHEVHNLRLLMDEIFGPENFVANCIWQKVFSPKNSARQFSEDHDYVLVYGRNGVEWLPNLLPRTEEMEKLYKNPDNDPRGPWMSDNLTARNYYSKGTYPIQSPGGRSISGPPPGTYWRVAQEKFDSLDADNRIWWGAEGDGVPRLKRFLSEVKDGRVPQTLWKYEEVGHTQEAKKELLARVEFGSSDSVFETPKPTRLIERMLRLATDSDGEDLVLDFFAGSGATGEAVWKLNKEDGGNRRFILVQLPEPTGYDDYETVADITRERLRAAGQDIDSGSLGYQSYSLGKSNFGVWGGGADTEDVQQALSLFAENVEDQASSEAIVTELLLKAGYELTTSVETLKLGGEEVHSVEDSQLLIFTGDNLTIDVVEEMVALRPSLILVLDRAFGDDDELKVNALQTVRSSNQGETDISLKVV